MKKTGTLYLIPNTLGDDTTIPAVLPAHVIEQAARLQHFIVENAKPARQFLKAIGTQTPLQQISMTELNVNTPDKDIEQLLAPLLDGHDVGLISDAGCPAVADPGSRAVVAAHKHNIQVRPLVGPSSILLALMASGLNGQKFTFHGYLPIDTNERIATLKKLEHESRQNQQTQMFIETPYRNTALFEGFCKSLSPQTQLCIATDITLATETITTQTIKQWQNLLNQKQAPNLHKRASLFLFLA